MSDKSPSHSSAGSALRCRFLVINRSGAAGPAGSACALLEPFALGHTRHVHLTSGSSGTPLSASDTSGDAPPGAEKDDPPRTTSPLMIPVDAPVPLAGGTLQVRPNSSTRRQSELAPPQSCMTPRGRLTAMHWGNRYPLEDEKTQ
jgi:hypothetical protein